MLLFLSLSFVTRPCHSVNGRMNGCRSHADVMRDLFRNSSLRSIAKRIERFFLSKQFSCTDAQVSCEEKTTDFRKFATEKTS